MRVHILTKYGKDASKTKETIQCLFESRISRPGLTAIEEVTEDMCPVNM